MSTIWKDEDIPSLIAATGGVPCVIDGVEGIALMDWNDELFAGDPARGQVIVGAPMLTVQTSQFPNARVDSAVTIDGNNYTVRERLKYGDGGTTKLFLGVGTSAPSFAIVDGGFFDGTGGIGPSLDGGFFDGTGAAGPSLDGGIFRESLDGGFFGGTGGSGLSVDGGFFDGTGFAGESADGGAF